MQLFKVENKADFKAFLKVPQLLYHGNPDWNNFLTRDLEKAVWDNSSYRTSSWILTKNHQLVGRIAAFVPHNLGKAGIGFFECIDDQDAANTLFDAAVKWFNGQDQKRILAPINAGDRDRFWGLMIGDPRPASYGENYHPKYYQNLFLNYGFTEEYTQHTPRIDLTQDSLIAMRPLLNRLKARYKWEFHTFKVDQLETFVSDFTEVYNDAWKHNPQYVPLHLEQVKELFKEMKPVLDPDLIYFAYRDSRPIAFFVALPDINPLLRKTGYSGGLLFKLKWLWYRKKVTLPIAKGLIFGVVESEQNKGVLLALADSFYQGVVKLNRYRWLELSWIGSFNPKMLSFVSRLKAKPHKFHRTYSLDINNRIT